MEVIVELVMAGAPVDHQDNVHIIRQIMYSIIVYDLHTFVLLTDNLNYRLLFEHMIPPLYLHRTVTLH